MRNTSFNRGAWMAAAWAALALLPAARGQDDRPLRKVADPDLQSAINQAVDGAIEYLKKARHADGSWIYDRAGAEWPSRSEIWAGTHDCTGGLTALALYALAASGLAKTDPVVRGGLAWCKDHPHPFTEGRRATYSAALLVLALTRIDANAHRKWIHRLAQRIADSQLVNGMWNYELPGRKTGTRPGSPGARWLANGDNSNSQFAVLALWSAQAMARFRVPTKVWTKVRKLYTRTQLEDGGWSYKEPLPAQDKNGRLNPAGAPLWMYKAKASMTAAGLVSYTCATAALKGGVRGLSKARQTDPAQRGVTAFLADRAGWDEWLGDYYYLYAIERVGTLLGLPEKTWYPDTARSLVRRQRDDGRWGGPPARPGFGAGYGDRKHVYQTSLALLFLSKATAYPITPRK